jgi:Glu-tRNA(Gln) amidotransferase subunit E-like FAD-binding protein
VTEILKQLAQDQNYEISKAQKLKISKSQLEKEVKLFIDGNKKMDEYKIRRVVMGEMMKKYRGKVSGKLISEILEKLL